MNKKYKIIFNADPDGDILSSREPVTPENVLYNMNLLENTQVDCYIYSVCAGDMLTTYPTKVGDMVGTGIPKGQNVFVDRLRNLINSGKDPVEIFSERARQLGMDFYASVRMNDCHHKSDQRGIWASRFWIENQQYRNWGVTDGACYYNGTLNYKHKEVRKRRMDIIEELVDSYELDGIELDFGRNPHLFNPEEAWELREIVTELMEEVKILTQNKGINLIVRVPSYNEQLKLGGIDLKAWISKGIADIIVMSCFKGNDYNLDLSAWKQLAGNNQIAFYGGIEMDIANNAPKWNYNAVSLPEHIYGIATNYHSQNLDGIYLFNYKNILCNHEYHNEFLRALNIIGDNKETISYPRTYAYYKDLPLELEVERPSQYGQEIVFNLNRNDLEFDSKIEMHMNITNLSPKCVLNFTINQNQIDSKDIYYEYRHDGLMKGGPDITPSKSGYILGALFTHIKICIEIKNFKIGRNNLGIMLSKGPTVEHTNINVYDLEVKVLPKSVKISVGEEV